MARIAMAFFIVMAFSFIPENFPDWFGDWKCEGGRYAGHGNYEGCWYTGTSHGPSTHWGFRHWMWWLLGICLFLYNISLIVASINKYQKENEE